MPLSALEITAVEQAAAAGRAIEVEAVGSALVATDGRHRLFAAMEREAFLRLVNEAMQIWRNVRDGKVAA